MRRMILLTPETAKKFLDNNYAGNRRINERWVNCLAADMTAGRWSEEASKLNPICVGVDGTLLNGQHRCAAVVMTGQPVRTWVEYEVPVELFPYMDGDMSRSTATFLNNIPNANAIAALAKVACAIEDGKMPLASAIQGKVGAKVNASRSQVLKKVEEQKDYLESIIQMASRAASYMGNKRGAIAIAFYVINFVDRGCFLDEFVDDCSSLVTDSEVVNICRSYMMQRLTQKQFNSTTAWVMGCIFCAYDHYVDCNVPGSFNRTASHFNKYDALMKKQRFANEENG